MNLDDFIRNFQRSWFAVDVDWIGDNCVPGSIAYPNQSRKIPCTSPRAIEAGYVQVTSMQKDGTSFHTKKIKFKWKEDLDEQPFFFCKAPRVGMVSFNDSFVYISRYPTRQYHRGYVPNSCIAAGTRSGASKNSYITSAHEVVYNIYNPVFYDFGNAVNILSSGERLGCPLGRALAIENREGIVAPILVYRDRDVGYVESEPHTRIRLDPEVSDYCVDYVSKICQVTVVRG